MYFSPKVECPLKNPIEDPNFQEVSDLNSSWDCCIFRRQKPLWASVAGEPLPAMLFVNARAGISAIHGIGLIAHDFIPHGAVVWELRPGFDLIFSKQQIRDLSAAAREQVFWYAYYDPTGRVYVLSADDDRFTNHSDDPNTANDGNVTFTTRNIQPGEEITGTIGRGAGCRLTTRRRSSGSPEAEPIRLCLRGCVRMSRSYFHG